MRLPGEAGKLVGERALAELATAFRHPVAVAGVIPFDERLPEAERAQAAPLDYAPDAPAVSAIAELAERLVTNGRA